MMNKDRELSLLLDKVSKFRSDADRDGSLIERDGVCVEDVDQEESDFAGGLDSC